MSDIKSFYKAKSVEDIINAFVKNPNAEIISGGTSVLMRVRKGKDARRSMVSIHNIEELKDVELLENGGLWTGAGTLFSHIIDDLLIQRYISMLGEVVDMVGGLQIRNTGTIGENICSGATSADSTSTMWTLEADMVLEGPDGRRIVPVCEFYTDPGKTVRDRCEVCTCFLIHSGSYVGQIGHYMKYGKRKAMEIVTLGYTIRAKLSEGEKQVEDARLGYDVAGPVSLRCRGVKEALKGCEVTNSETILESGRGTLTEVNPRSSWRVSKEFGFQLIEELSKRTLVEAIRTAGGKINV